METPQAPAPDSSEPSPPADTQSNRNISFVMNVASVEGTEPAEIIRGLVLRRATAEERKRILQQAVILAPSFNPGWSQLWETYPVEVGSGGYSFEPLPPDQFRYFVLDSSLGSENVRDFKLFQTFSSIGLEIGFTFEDNSVHYNPEGLFQHQSRLNTPWTFYRLTLDDLRLIQSTFLLFLKHDNSIININHVANRLQQLEGISDNSELKFLGYFGELEGLLTHNPKPSDPYDSITRQITNKLRLLINRMQNDPEKPQYPLLTHDKTWSLMYTYRSAIAHGSTADFSGKLQALVSAEYAFAHLRGTLRRVLRYALTEPQLFVDLKSC